jgi:type IV secretion system protein VirD4
MPDHPRDLRHDPLAWIIGCLFAATIWFFVSSEVAAIVFGPKHQSLPDASSHSITHALFGAARHLGNPRSAWTPADQAVLPGAVGYWAAGILTLLIALGLMYAIAQSIRNGKLTNIFSTSSGSRRSRLGADTQTKLATYRDVAPLIVARPTPGRITLGHLGSRKGPLLATEDEGEDAILSKAPDHLRWGRSSVIVIGPTRSGKTTGLAVPAICEWKGPVLALSAKADLLHPTLASRKEVGETKIFDPYAVTGLPAGRWSPLRGVVSYADAVRAAKAISAPSFNSDRSESKFWAQAAEDMVAPYLFAAAHSERDMSDVCHWVSVQDSINDETSTEVQEILMNLLNSQSDLTTEAAAALRSMLVVQATAPPTRASILLFAKLAVNPWSTPQVAESARNPDISPDWLWSGSNTLYVCAPSHQQEELLPVFLGIVTDVLNQASESAERNGGTLPNRLLVVIDEAANICPLPDLPKYASSFAGKGIQFMTIFQDMSQIVTRYGQAAQSVVNNHGAKVFFGGISDPETLKMVSQLVGDEEYEQVSRTVRPGEQASITEGTQMRSLLPSELIRRIPKNQALLVYGRLRPAHLFTRPFALDSTSEPTSPFQRLLDQPRSLLFGKSGLRDYAQSTQ